MKLTAWLAFALLVSTGLWGCCGDEPLSLEPGRRAFVDNAGSSTTIAWTKTQADRVPRDDSFLIDCGTTGIYLGDDDGDHRFKPDIGPVVWLMKGDLRPVPIPEGR